MVRKKVAIFVAFAFALDWVLWLVAGLVTDGFSRGISGMPWGVLLPAGMFGPMAAALITNRISPVLLRGRRVRLGTGAGRPHPVRFRADRRHPALAGVPARVAYAAG